MVTNIFKMMGSIKFMPKYFMVKIKVTKSNFNDSNKLFQKNIKVSKLLNIKVTKISRGKTILL